MPFVFGMTKFIAILIAGAAIGCADAQDDAVQTGIASAEIEAAPFLDVDSRIASDLEQAVDLWSRATDGAFVLPSMHVRYEHITECVAGDTSHPVGCWHGSASAVLSLSPKCQQSHRVAVLAHEIGHSLGLQHTIGGLMDPDHPQDSPCVSAADVTAAGFTGPGACLQ